MTAPQLLSERIHFASILFCMPITLLINFSLFQYLSGIFYRRRREPRVFVLLGCAFVGFAVLIPFSHPDRNVYAHLDRVSELCSAMTFLIQITIIGRDINKKMRIRALRSMTHAGECLTALGVVFALIEFVEAVVPGVSYPLLDDIEAVIEDVALVFIFVFRFYYIAMSKGLKTTILTRKAEILLYVLFATHPYPFVALHAWTQADWEPVQALWKRFTLMLCILHTIREKIRAGSRSTRGLSTHGEKSVHASSVASGIGASTDGQPPSVGPNMSTFKASTTRPSQPSKLPAWRSGKISAVQPS